MDFGNFNQELINHLINERSYSLKKNISLGLIQNLEFGAPEGTSSKVAEKYVEDFLNTNDKLSYELKNGTFRVVIEGYDDIKLIAMTAYSVPLLACCLMTITDVKVSADSLIH